MNILRWFLIAVAVALFSWIGYTSYCFFFDTSVPVVVVSGITPGSYIAGDMYCVVRGSDEYKVGDISVFLDGKPLIANARIGRSEFEFSFPLATKVIPNGKHTLKILVRDSSMNQNQTIKEFDFYIDNMPLQVAFVRADNDLKVFQGRTVHLQFQANKPLAAALIKGLAQPYPCVAEAPGSLIYECFIPIRSEEMPSEYLLTVEATDNVGAIERLDAKLQVVPFPFKKQNLVLKDDKVKHENEVGKSDKEFEADVARVTVQSPCIKLWQGSFDAPIEIKGISTDYGTIRTTQQRGKYQHNAVDILSTPRGVVWASQDGIVVLKDRYAHSGNTIVIDHGCGVLSMYFHLEEMAPVKVGDKIKKGNPVGTLGMTGYASGYHLHWEMRIGNIPVDPMQWIKMDF